MLQNERIPNLHGALLALLDQHQAGMWTAIPGAVQSFDADAMTVTVQPGVKERWRDKDGNLTVVQMPVLLDVPVVFQGGGGYTLTFPIAKDDECLVVFASRCIDGWWQNGMGSDGSGQAQTEIRFHDLSDGFAIVGLRSKPRALSGISASSTQLRSDDGSTYVEVADGQIVNVVAPGGINIDTDGDIVMTAGGKITGTATANVEMTGAAIKETAVSGSVTLISPVSVINQAPITLVNAIQTGAGGGGGGGNVTITGNITHTGTTSHTGNVSVTGTIGATGEITSGGTHTLTAHKHGGVTTGGGQTGTPTG